MLETHQRTQQSLRTARGAVSMERGAQRTPIAASPFGIPAMLPLLAALFTATCAAVLLDAQALALAGGFAFLGIGLMAIAAIGLGGTVELTDEGITFSRSTRSNRLRRVEQGFTAGWSQVVGLRHSRVHGVGIALRDPKIHGASSIGVPGGISADAGGGFIPLRALGAHRERVLAELEAHLEEPLLAPALSGELSPRASLLLAMATTVVAAASILVYAVFAV